MLNGYMNFTRAECKKISNYQIITFVSILNLIMVLEHIDHILL